MIIITVFGIIALVLTGLAFGLRESALLARTFLHFLAFMTCATLAVVMYLYLPSDVNSFLPTAGALLCLAMCIVHAATAVIIWLTRYSSPTYDDERKAVLDRLTKYLPKKKDWWDEEG